MLVRNTTTGSGLERVLTTSDLVGAGGSPTDQLHVVGGDGITVTTGSPEVTVAVDATASTIMGINPKSVNHIMLASKEGIGNMEFVLVGDSISFFKESFPKPTIRYKGRKILANLYTRFLKN